MDPARQAQLWSQVERNKELIRKHEQEIHQTDTWHAICGATLEFLGQLADRAARERERAREEARRWRADPQKEGPPLQ